MSLAPGTRIGGYEVIGLLGAGGMGEVYRARDTRLDRDVALKILPPEFATDVERVARFRREAKTLASINHPHIAQIHGLEESADPSTGSGQGTLALVMELVEGEDLSQRLKRGPIPIDEALAIARQIAEALEAAHDQGIVHRDLKPANIKVTPDGTVKVLDFGLAKAIDPGSGLGAPGIETANTPTITSPFDFAQGRPAMTHLRQGYGGQATEVGVILGTAIYMAPEQAKGKPVDRRADIWAFGCVLYEMLTGTRAFDGEDTTEILGAIVKTEPDWTRLPPSTPPTVVTLLRRCLQKDPRKRQQHIGDARIEIDEAIASSAQPSSPGAASAVPATGRLTPTTWWLAAILTGIAAATAGLSFWPLRPSRSEPPRVARLALTTPTDLPLTPSAVFRDLAVAPDGTFVVYPTSGFRFVVRRLDRLDATPLPGAVGLLPAVSPDSRWIAYVDNRNTIWKIGVGGEEPRAIGTFDQYVQGVAWLDQDSLVVGISGPEGGLWKVPAAGGKPVRLTTVGAGERMHRYPSVLPDGSGVLFTVWMGGFVSRTDLLELRNGQRTAVLNGSSDATYVPTGHLAYFADGNGRATAVKFDLATRSVVGEPASLPDNAPVFQSAMRNAAFSADGMLAYIAGGQDPLRALVWVDRDGRETPVGAPERPYRSVRLSPDGQRIAVSVQDENTDIWIWDIGRRAFARLTFDPGADTEPTWTPDGRGVVYNSDRNGSANIWIRPADGSGTDRQITNTPLFKILGSVSPGGAVLYLEIRPSTGSDLLSAAISVPATPGSESLLVGGPGDQGAGEVSPNGKYIAYDANETGQLEIYVRPYPNVNDGRWQVSSGGGTRPTWTRDGRELIFRDPLGHVQVASVATKDGAFTSESNRRLFSQPYPLSIYRSFDISPDGRRLLVIKNAGANAPPQIVVVQNWFEELRRLLP